jgi:hypothetical protein
MPGDDATEAETLRKAFEFAAKAVMMLKSSPGLMEKKRAIVRARNPLEAKHTWISNMPGFSITSPLPTLK